MSSYLLSIFLQLYWGTYLKYATWCFDIHIHCEMITTIKLIKTSITSQIPFLLLFWECLRYTLFLVYSITIPYSNTVLLTIVTILCWIPRNYSPYNWKCVPFDQYHPIFPTLQSISAIIPPLFLWIWFFFNFHT